MNVIRIRTVVLALALLQGVPGVAEESGRTPVDLCSVEAARRKAAEAIEVIEALWQSGQLSEVLGETTDHFKPVRDPQFTLGEPMPVYAIALDDLRKWKQKASDHADYRELIQTINQLVFPIKLASGEHLGIATVGKSKGTWELFSVEGNPKIWKAALETIVELNSTFDDDSDVASEEAIVVARQMLDNMRFFFIEVPAMYQRFWAVANEDGSIEGLINRVADERVARATNGKLGKFMGELAPDEAFDELWKLSQEWEGALARKKE